MINRVILIGNLTRDAESVAGARTTMTRMRLATNSVWRDAEGNRQESSEYHTVVTFGRTAEICAEYCMRGRRIYVDGRLRTREYDGTDGIRRTATEIVADSVKLLDRPPAAAGAADEDGREPAEAEAASGASAPLTLHATR